MACVSDIEMRECVASAAIGALVLTRHLLTVLSARPNGADIHTIVSTSGLINRPLDTVSVAFKTAKTAQAGFVDGLAEELADTKIRVTSVMPGNFEDVSPEDSNWSRRGAAWRPSG